MMFRRIVLAASALAALAIPQSAAQSAGQAPSRGGGYGVLADMANGFLNIQSQYGASIVTTTLESALKRSRDAARADSHTIPDDVRQALVPFFSEELLDKVRYSIGDTTPAGVAGFAIRNGNAAAVTLIDTVVFKDEGYVRNIALWAHELHHVEQYLTWGVAGFSTRYAFGWKDVEAEATARASEFVAWYKKRTGQD
jgi:hypothetical protein